MTLDDLPTPCLVLDLGILKRNLAAHGRRRWRGIRAWRCART